MGPLILSLLLALLPAHAARIRPAATAPSTSVPENITFTALLLDNGIPPTETRSMVFRVYDAAGGGNLVWTSQTFSVHIDRGYLTVSIPVPVSALGGGGPRYLEVTAGSILLSPRARLAAVPYALVARTIEGTLDISGAGLSISSTPSSGSALFVSSQTGRVGVGTTAPAYHLDVQGDIRSTGAVTSARWETTVAVLSGSTFTVGGTALVIGASAAGIGAASADQRLTVAGNVSMTGTLFSSGTQTSVFLGSAGIGAAAPTSRLTVFEGDILIATTSPASRGLYFADGSFMTKAGVGSYAGLSNAGNVTVQADSDSSGQGMVLLRTAGLDRLSVANDGKVGVGTVSPEFGLDVRGAAQFGGGATRSTFTAAGALDLVAGSTIAASGTLSISTASAANLTGVPALFLDREGRTGAGTAAPAARLHSAGDLRSDGDFLVAPGTAAARKPSATLLELGSRGNFELQLLSNSATPRVYLPVIGGVGIASATPGGLLRVGAGTLNAMAVDASGNIGLGVGSPTRRLDVDGGILVDGSGAGLDIDNGVLAVSGNNVGIGVASPGVLLQVGSSGLAALTEGRVGMGTTAPSTTLEVAGDAIFGSVTRSTFTAAGNLAVAGNISAATFNGLPILVSAMATPLTLNGSPSLSSARSGIEVSTHLFVSAGRFGLGTTSPGTSLHLSSGTMLGYGTGSGIRVGLSTFVVTSGLVGVGAQNPGTLLHISSGTILIDGPDPFFLVGESSFRAAAGRVGFGTSSPQTLVHVSSGVVIVDGAGAGLSVGVSTLVVTGGQTGVGTAAPGALLDVEGSARFGAGAFRSTVTAAGELQLVSGSTVAFAGTLSISTAATVALTGAPALFFDKAGRTGLGTAAPDSALTIGAPSAGSWGAAGAAVHAGALPAVAGNELALANFGMTAGGNAASLGLRAHRTAAAPNDWTTTAVGLSYDVDNTPHAGAALWLHANGHVGIGTTAPQSRLHLIDGDVRLSTTTGTAGVVFRDGSRQTTAETSSLTHWEVLGANIYNTNTGRLGIGVVTPAAFLDVGGRIRIHPDATLSSVPPAFGARVDVGMASVVGDCPRFSSYLYFDENGQTWLYGANTRAGFLWGACSDDLWSLWSAPVSGGAAAGTGANVSPRLTVTAAGKVGIGTTAPGYNFVVEDGAGPILRLQRDATNDWFLAVTPTGSNRLGFRALANLAANEKLTIMTDGKAGIGITNPLGGLDVPAGMAVGSYAAANAAPANGLIVSGKLGIGQSNPTSLADVAGLTARGIRYTRSAAGISKMDITEPGGTWSVGVGNNATAGQLSVMQAGTDRLTVTQTGNVGFGATSPASLLDAAGAMAVGTYAGVSAGPANGLIVSGSLGVGVTNPTFALTVVGEIGITASSTTARLPRLWGKGRPGTGTTIYGNSCTVGGITARLSGVRVRWENAEDACPLGTWVCTSWEKTKATCDTPRPASTCDYVVTDGTCADTADTQNWGLVADQYADGMGMCINEDVAVAMGCAGNAFQFEMPVWCCN